MRRAILIASLAMATTAMAADETFDPKSLRIEDAIACKLDVPAYNGFALWLAGTDNGAQQLGWAKVPSRDPLLVEYQLPAPVAAFGHRTDHIAFASTAVMAILPGVDPSEIGQALGITNIVPDHSRFLGEKVIARSTTNDDALNMRLTYTTAYSVSTVKAFAGATLAGCSYRTEEGEGRAGQHGGS